MVSVSRWSALVLFLICQISVQAQQRSANDPWWFEVEAIIFERNVDTTNLKESFPLQITPIETTALPSFLTDTLYPDFTLVRMGARLCLDNNPTVKFPNKTVPSEQMSDIDGFWGNVAFREQLLEKYKFTDSDYILENSPTKQWLPQLTSLFDHLNQNFAHWQQQNLPARQIALYPVQEVTGSGFTPRIQLPKTLYCNWSEEADYIETEFARELKTNRFLVSVPRIIDGIEYPFSDKAYTLPADKLALKKLRKAIQRRRGLNVLLHTAWRQNVVIGRSKAPWYRLYAGDNLSRQYDYKGLPVVAQEASPAELQQQEANLFAHIQTILEQPEDAVNQFKIKPPPAYEEIANRQLGEGFEEVWTLDGRVKIFIEYIGGTPYLHIDSDLNYRKPVHVDWQALGDNSQNEETFELTDSEQNPNAIAVIPADNFLQSYHFDQIRRVISNEIHYFDHPLFGMVFQIRRYRRPDPELPPDYYSTTR